MDDPASIFFLFSTGDASTAAEPTSYLWSTVGLISVALLVFANGFFVASEFALVAVRKSRIEALAADGDKAANRLLGMLNNLNAYISATQLGITLSSLGLGWIGEPAVAALLDPFLIWLTGLLGMAPPSPTVLHGISFAIAFGAITFLHIVFGELAPKTAALELSERVSFAVAVPLLIFYKIFYPFIRMLDWAGTKTVRLFGLHPSGEHGSSSYTEDEIRQLVRVSQESGHLNEEEQRLINQVFEFSETTVKEAMVPRTEIVAVSETCSLGELANAFERTGYSRLPVHGGSLDDMIGIVHVKDILNSMLRPKSFRLEKVLQKPNYVVDTARLEDVLRQMQQEKFHFGFVVDEHGGIEGIITLEDLLEEIVGDISDEHDEEVNEQIDVQPDGSFVLDGAIAVRDLNRRLELNLPVSEAYTTVAGFLMAEAGQVLNEGDAVPFNGHIFRVERAEKRRILRVRMEKNHDVPEPAVIE